MADATRDVELRLRASNLTSAGLKEAITNLNALNGSLESQARAAKEALAAHQAAMAAGTASGKAAETAMRGYERALSAVEKQLQTNKASVARFSAELQKQNDEARRAEISGHLTAFNARVDANRRQVKALEDFNAETKRLTAKRHADETSAARKAVDDIRKIQQDGQRLQLQPTPTGSGQPRTDALGRPGRGASGQIGFLGLRPYELTNLGYQVNDVVSGLISGQNATQVLAQQGGQFIQIFGMQVLRWFPLVAVAAGAITVAIGAITTELRTLSSNREFTAALTTNKFAIDQTAGSLTKLRKELYDLGVTWDDAGKVIQQMLAANVLPSAQENFAKLAEAISKVKGTDIKSVVTDLIEGFSGGRKALEDLIAKYPALDREQITRIRRLFEEGKADDAHRLALQLLLDAFEKGRKENLSKFDEAAEKLRKTWHDLLEQLAEKGAFSYLEKVMIFFVDSMGNAITTTEAFIRLLESVDKRFPWLKYVSLGPIGLAKGVTDLATGAFGGGAPTPQGGPGRFTTGSLPVDSEELKTLVAILSDATRALPPGYRAEAISTERPGATVRKTGEPSEHAAGRAIDVRIVDANGQPVPGSMGAGGPMYDILDKAVAAMAAARGIGPIAIGSTFGTPDAGHYSIAGREAARNAARRGETFPDGSASVPGTGGVIAPSAKRVLDIENEIRVQKEALDIQKARTREEQEAAIIAQARREAEEKITGEGAKALQDQYVANKLEEHRQQTRSQDFEREQTRRKAAEADKNPADTARAEAAGRRAVDEALKNNITNFEQLESARDKGASEERTRIAKERQDREALQELLKTFSTDLRTLELKHASDLTQALEAVNIKYKQRLEAIDKLKDRSKDLSEAEISKLKEQAEQLKKIEEAEARVTAAKKGADEALSARSEAIRTINRLEELGEITLQQKEDMTKQAFTDSRKSILAMADALEKSIDPTRMSATEVEKLTNQVKLLRAEAKYIDPFWKGLKDTFSESLTSGLSSSFNTISEAIGGAIAKTKQWKDVFTSVKQAAAELFAKLLKDIAEYILKAQAAKLASSLFGGIGGGGGGFSFGGLFSKLLGFGSQTGGAGGTGLESASAFETAFTGSWAHSGGVVGQTAFQQRPANPSWWANAPRYHNGRMVGLAPDEEAAILKRGEEVLSEDNPRNIMNSGRGGRGDINIRNVLVDDRARIPEAMTGAHGERVIIQHLVNNAATIRELVRG